MTKQTFLSETVTRVDSSNPITVVYNESTGDMAIDYSDHLERIALSLEKIEEHQKKIRELSEGSGIRYVGPLDILNFISTYRFLIEGREILKETPPLSDKELDKSLKRLDDYVRKISQLPKEF